MWNPYDQLETTVTPDDSVASKTRLAFQEMKQGTVSTGKFDKVQATLRDLQYETNGWDRHLWEKVKDRTPGLCDAVASGTQQAECYEGFAREVFARLHNSGDLQRIANPNPCDGWAGQLHSEMEQLPEYHNLRLRTVGDAVWAGIGSAVLAESMAMQLQDANKENKQLPDTKRLENRLDALKRVQGDGEDPELTEQIKQASQAIHAAKNTAQALIFGVEDNESNVRQAIRKAVAEATQQIKDAEEGLAALTCGEGSGVPGQGITADKKLGLGKKIRQSRKLQEIARMAGRLKAMAAAKRKERSDKFRTDMHSIETGKDPQRLLPSEFALLENPDSKYAFYAKYSDASLLQYKLDGKEPKGRGPVIVCVDNSASMNGLRELWSKAVVLALLENCVKDKRNMVVYHFDEDVRARFVFEHSNPPAPELLISMLEFFSSGGTSLEQVLLCACKDVEKGASTGLDKADIVVITDGAVDVSKGLQDKVKQAQADTGLNVLGIVLEGHTKPLEDLGATCHSLVLDTRTQGEDSAALDTLLTL